uniref:EGF-like domain-containing protein n=1 Tax=Amphimedon queenslandica TaxID=400682 RepID=A0A1X7VD60_AMPQE
INECNSTGARNCSHFCNNTIGSYQCTCMSGYELHSDGRSCNEINECERLLDNCQQECMNTDGSFNCSCYDGFLLQNDGRSCQNDPNRECLGDNMCEQFCVYDNYTKTENCSCQSGYDLSSNMANCTDIDECLETNPCTQICINTIGSFECNCLDGFQLQSDGFTCTDIDECLVLGSCPEPRIRCVNSPGSFDCFCPLGTVFQHGSCNVIVDPVSSSSLSSTYLSSLSTSLVLASPSVTPTPTVPANSGVVVILNGTNASTFDRESFKNITAEALNDYCSSNECTGVSSQKRKRTATNTMIEPDDIVITETTETSNGLRAANSRYANAGFTIASLTLLNPPSTTIVVTPTTSATPTDDGLSAGQIAGITIGVLIGTLLTIVIIISVACFIYYRKKSNKVLMKKNDDEFAVENLYYEPTPNPEGLVNSMKLKFAQDFDRNDKSESDMDNVMKKRESKVENAWSTAGNTHIVGILPMRASPFISLVITTSETETVNFTVSSLSQRIANGSVTSGTPTHISDSILISYAVSNESDRYKGILVSTGTDKTLSVTVVMMDSFNSAGVYVNYPISVCTVNNHSYVYYAVSIGTTETTSFSSLLIVSGNNNTNITITPTVTVTIPPNLTQSGHQTVLNAGQSITIQLHYLETLLLKPVVALADLTGTKVESSKPLSVYSGHTCGVIPPDRDDCDFVGEQLPPVVSWGKELLVQSFYNRQSGYILKIIGSQSNTNIDITCADGSNYFLSLQEGGVLNQTVSQTSCYINSTSPILVAQFVLGYFRYMYEPGDSAMTIIPPLHQYGNNVTSFSLISLLGAPVSVNLVVLAADESSQIQLNGTVLPSLTSSSWKRYNSSVGGSYVFNSTIIEDIDFGGNYIVEIRVWSNNSNDKILAMVYGLGRLFGYSYTGTLNQSPIEAYEGEYCQDLNSIVPNTPPVIEASDTFMITVGEKALYTLHITDPGDTISVTIDGEFPYTLDQNGSIWTLNVTLSSFVEFSFSVIASDSFNATSVITPQVRICGCPADRGNCTFEGVQNASSNPLILICNCIEAYKGDYCEDDFDGCTEVSCFNDATCTDVPAPGTGATCPPCPSGYTGDGIVCNVTLVTLPYILFNSSISEVTNITRHYLYSTWRVNAPRPINLLGSAYSSIYISISGTFSMNGRFNYLYSTLFPSSTHGIRDSVVFAPMWNFYDIRREGSISYQTFSSNNPLANEVFNDVNSFIRASKNITSYKGIWMLVMEWKDVHPYPHGSYYYYYYYYYNEILEKHNTFQAILTTDGSDTHIIYTYKCGDIMWDNYYSRSVVGYNIAGGRYENHRGSGIPGELLKLGCNDDMNQPANYTNIVYSFQSDEKRQVQNDTESLLTYATGETFANYSNPNHIPVFLDQIDSETRVEAERICGGSNKIECIFDYSQTKNEELALDTQTTMEQNELKKQIGNNLPPVIEASDTFMLTVGETALYTINITDPGDTISVTIDGEFPHTLDQDGSIWTLNVTHSSLVKFSFNVIASDSFNATSVITPQVRICGCPADRGNCTIEGVQNASSNPLILICDCIEAYEGEYCEGDFDGCTEVSCFNDATCTDVPAPGTGATCPPCPNGYTGDGLICD